jgi:guanine nucleotide-binding protein subunit beta-2-like 1 protein
LVWNLNSGDPNHYGVPKRALTGHSHFVEDVVLTSDGHFALSGSADKTLRLWDLTNNKTRTKFVGHKNDVTSVAFSADNRQIISGSRDGTMKVWNTLGDCKDTFVHNDWVTSVKFSLQNSVEPHAVSVGYDKSVRVWNLNKKSLAKNLTGHTGILNAVAVAPNGTLCASGGKDGKVKVWDLVESGPEYDLEAGSTINALAFSPSHLILVAATQRGLKFWNLKKRVIAAEVDKKVKDFFPNRKKSSKEPKAFPISLAWSFDGSRLFVGYTDHNLRVFEVSEKNVTA